jgi:hypothetical protein
MDDRVANIDLVFRNGLKDYEVLPPQEVWSNIHPVIKSRSSLIPFVKAAASVAVIVSLGFLAYWWGVKTSDEVPAEVVAVNMEPLSPVTIIVPPMIADQKSEMDEVGYAQPLTADVETQTAEGSAAGQQPLAEIANLHGSRDLITAYQSDTDLQIPYGVKYSKITYTEPVRYELMPDEIEMPVVERWSVTAMASPTYYSQFTSSGNDLAKQIMESDQTRVS